MEVLRYEIVLTAQIGIRVPFLRMGLPRNVNVAPIASSGGSIQVSAAAITPGSAFTRSKILLKRILRGSAVS